MSSDDIVCLNDNLRVIQYNGGQILGKYGAANIFKVPPGQKGNPIATRAGQNIDIVVEYTPEVPGGTFELTQFVVVSPEWSQVTSPLKSGAVFVHSAESTYVTHTPEDVSNIAINSYTSSYDGINMSNYHDKITSLYNKSPSSVLPSAIFDLGEKVENYVCPVNPYTSNQGKYIHIKLTSTFDDDYNIDMGHFYIIGRHIPPATTLPALSSSPIEQIIKAYSTTKVSDAIRAYLLTYKYIDTIVLPHVPSSPVQILTDSNQNIFFESSCAVFVSSVPVANALAHITNGTASELEQSVCKAFTTFVETATGYTKAWQYSFGAHAIQDNLAREMGKDSKKITKTQQPSGPIQLDAIPELKFLLVDPTTSPALINIVLAFFGFINTENIVHTDQQPLPLLQGSPWAIASIAATEQTGLKFIYDEQDFITSQQQYEYLLTNKALAENVTTFISSLDKITTTDTIENVKYIKQFFGYSAIAASFLPDYTESCQHAIAAHQLKPVVTSTLAKKNAAMKKSIVNKKDSKAPPTYPIEQQMAFLKLLKQRVLSQYIPSSKDDNTTLSTDKHDTIAPHHPLYPNIHIMSRNTLIPLIYQRFQSNTVPHHMLVMPYDRTTDLHLDLLATLFEYSQLLSKHDIPIDIYLYDALCNDLHPLLNTPTYLNSAKLFAFVDKIEQSTASATATAATTGVKGTNKGGAAAGGKKATTTTATKGGKSTTATASSKNGGIKGAICPVFDITTLLPTIDQFVSYHDLDLHQIPSTLSVISVDLIFNRMIDQEILAMVEEAGEEVPPPTALELSNYLLRVSVTLRELTHNPTFSLVPTTHINSIGEKMHPRDTFLYDLDRLSSSLEDLSMMRMFDSTILPGLLTHYRIIRTENDYKQVIDAETNIKTAIHLSPEMLLSPQKPPVMVTFPPDSAEYVLLNAIRVFREQSHHILERLAHPVGLLDVPFTSNSTTELKLASPDTPDYADPSKTLPQIITLSHNRVLPYAFNAIERITMLRGTFDVLMNTLSKSSGTVAKTKSILSRLTDYFTLYPQETINICNKIKNGNDTKMLTLLQTFITNIIPIYINIGAVYLYKQIPSILISYFDTTFNTNLVSKTSNINPDTDCIYDEPVYTTYISSLDEIAEYITTDIDDQIVTYFKDMFITSQGIGVRPLKSFEELQRLLEGYVNVTPPAPIKSIKLSRNAKQSTSSSSTTNTGNNKYPDADERIYVVWLGSWFDKTNSIWPQLAQRISSIKTTLLEQYKQSVDFAYINVDAFPDILEQLGLEGEGIMPTLLFFQTEAERADLRSVGIIPSEMPQLLEDSLLSFVDPDGYDHGDLTVDDGLDLDADDNDDDADLDADE